MSNKGNDNKKELQISSSAAEYLTFIAAKGNDEEAIEMRYENENIWLTQKMMATLYNVSTSAINQHLKTIYADSELQEEATIKNFLTVQKEGNRSVSRETKHYNLQAIIAVGFKVNNERAVQFRKWANQIVKDYTIKGWEGSPDSKIHKYDVRVAKNYLNEKELNQMQRIVSAYLDMAELQAERNIPMTMEDWEKRLNGFLELWDSEILQDAGKVTAALAKKHAESEFEKYRIIQDKLYKSDFDKFLELEDKTDNIEK